MEHKSKLPSYHSTSCLTSTFTTTKLSVAVFRKAMLKLWPTTPSEQLTPKPLQSSREEERNPFDYLSAASPTSKPRTPTTPGSSSLHPLLGAYPQSPQGNLSSANADVSTPIGTPTLGPVQTATHLSLHAPDFKMQQPPSTARKALPSKPSKASSSSTTLSSTMSASSTSTSSGSHGSVTSRGQIHVKLIQARGLSIQSPASRPYVVVQFEQNEFVSREPIAETDKEAKGTATSRSGSMSTTTSSAMSALGAIGNKDASIRAAAAATSGGSSGSNSANTSPSSSLGSARTAGSGISNGLFGRLSAHNPVWKHEVSFDVTMQDSPITFNVYDRSVEDTGFLGNVRFKPVLVHEHTIDQWYKLQPLANEVVTGEMRVQITFEQYKTKRTLTPRDFEFLKLIGRGTFGKVFQVRKRDTKRIYAMKVLSKKEIVAKKEVAHTIGERKILQRSLDSPFLVGLKFSFQTDTDLYLVTDFKSGGELFWHLQRETRFTEERARFYVAELILALEHLHKFDIVYRDLKPENILLDATGHVALCDFGLSKADLRADELTTTFCGTTEYLAPEILLSEQGYSKIVDFWSLGVLLFEMCCGWSPFYAEDVQQMYKNICFGKIRFPKGVINEDGKQFVKGLLNRNPNHRLGAQRDAAELKEHPFFKSIDWAALAQKQVTPPFKPIVESDESVNNFDPEFTSADLRDVAANEMDLLDEDNPSESWTEEVLVGSMTHTPRGPLGSDTKAFGWGAVSGPTSPTNGVAQTNGTSTTNGVHAPASNGSSPSRSQNIQIKPKKKAKDAAGSPLTNSVQAEFQGFTYQGRESVIIPGHLAQMVRDREDDEPSTEDEFNDSGRSVGRLAHARRKGQLVDDDFA